MYTVVVPSAPIVNVMAQSISSRMAVATWEDGTPPNPVNPNITNYSVLLDGGLVANVTSRSVTLRGLIPFTDYIVSVVARNRIGDSTAGSFEFTTLEEGM